MKWRQIKKYLVGEFSLKRMVLSIILIYITLSVIGYFSSEQLIFPYRQSSYDRELNYQVIETGDGKKIAYKHYESPNSTFTLFRR